MKWVTRKGVRLDRTACAWLIQRHIDPRAEIIYVEADDLPDAIEEGALPFHDLGATTVTMNRTTGTDHESFDRVGLPGFQFIQDALDYETRTHHSNMDLYERLDKDDLMEASVIMATFAYEAAMRDSMLPRKPLPTEESERRDDATPAAPKRGTPTPGPTARPGRTAGSPRGPSPGR